MGSEAICRRVLLGGLLLLLPLAITAQPEMRGYGSVHASPDRAAAEALPLPLASFLSGIETLRSFEPATSAARGELEELVRYNERSPGRLQIGLTRGAVAHRVELDERSSRFAGPTSRFERFADTAVWAGAVRVEEAWAIRVRLDEVQLPPGARIWLTAPAQPDFHAGPFTQQHLDPEEGLWLPAAPGSEVRIEVRFEASELAASRSRQVGWTVGRVVEAVDLGAGTADGAFSAQRLCGHDALRGTGDWDPCRVDAMCVEPSTMSAIANYREAVARLIFMEGEGLYTCSGALLADAQQSGTPYLLTAHHCFSDQAAASSLTAYFDFRRDACGGTAPNLFDVPTVWGSTLLATRQESDFTLVQLTENPSGTNHYLGWTAERPEAGDVIHRVAHPAGMPQHYQSGVYFPNNEGVGCAVWPRNQMHYSTQFEGSSTGGASGGPAILDRNGGQLVGQILGYCYIGSRDLCNSSTFDSMDGSFEYTHPWVEPWLGSEIINPIIFADGFESGSVSAWGGAP